jgi:hypothetical protein
MTSYNVTVSRDGSLWAAVVSGLQPNVIGATDLLEGLKGSEHAYADAAAAREDAWHKVIHALAAAHIPQSAIGDVLGLSHQRVHQLVRAG